MNGAPSVAVVDDVVLVTLHGTLHAEIVETIIERVARHFSATRPLGTVLDARGVDIIDTHIAGCIAELARTIKLLGGRMVLAGVRPAVAMTIVELGIELSGVETARDVRQGIEKLRGE